MIKLAEQRMRQGLARPRIAENFSIFNFQLGTDDLEAITKLETG
jgi:diketogulonate reductase-like aldo/keto reductase